MEALPEMDMKTGLLSLPPELHVAVIDLVNVSDLQSLRLTCSAIYSACLTRRKPTATFHSASALLSMLFADILARVDSEKPVMRAILAQLKSVTITYLRVFSPSARCRADSDGWDRHDVHPLARPCPHLAPRVLKVLRVFGSPELCPLLKHLRLQLEDLFDFGQLPDENSCTLDNTISLPYLQTLEYHSRHYSPTGFLSNCSSLKCLHVWGGTLRNLGAIKFPSVTDLRILSQFDYSTEAILSKFPHSFPSLQELAIDDLDFPGVKGENAISKLKKAILKIPTLRALIFTMSMFVPLQVDMSVHGPYGSLYADFLKNDSPIEYVLVRAKYPVAYEARNDPDESKILVTKFKVTKSLANWPFRPPF